MGGSKISKNYIEKKKNSKIYQRIKIQKLGSPKNEKVNLANYIKWKP